LPPVFHVSAIPPQKPAAPAIPEHSKGKTVNGHDYVVAHRDQDVKSLNLVYPGIVIFSPDEIREMKGMSPDDAEKILIAKKVFGGTVKETKPVDFDPEPLPPEPAAIQEELIY
jgi:hypothetical protein